MEWLEQVLKISNKNRFGAKSERLKEQLIEGMVNLFDEAEATKAVEEHLEQEEESTVVPEHVRRKRRKAEDIIANLPEDTPTEIIEHYLTEEEAKYPKGADGSSVMFSLIETAKENKLDPYRYLTYIFKTAPNLDQSQANWIETLLPENAPDECKLTYKHK